MIPPEAPAEGKEFYHYTYPELCQLIGETRALEKVDMYQQPVYQHLNCRLLASYHNQEPGLLERRCSVFYAPVTNTTRQKQLTIAQVAELIRSPAFKPQTDHLRTITDKKENRKYKAAAFSYATFSGTFTRRANNCLIQHANLICVDLDHIGGHLMEVRAKVMADPETVLCFVSPNGDGLKVLYEVDPHSHTQEDWYKACSNYLGIVTGISMEMVDKSCKDVSRACFLPHDPELFINPRYTTL